MTNHELIRTAIAIINSTNDLEDSQALHAEACEFLRVYGGKNNSFLKALNTARYISRQERFDGVKRILDGYVRYLDKGLSSTLSPERKIQIETVSDYMGQADDLLANSKVHPAAAAVLIGASLEEFLRGWCEDQQLVPRQPTIDGYMQTLREQDLINKQDVKEITSWAGMRNDAAHGHWDKVSDRKRIQLMLEGVNLFIRSYSS
nr:hypothetical protein [Pedobacter panaciterrae]